MKTSVEKQRELHRAIVDKVKSNCMTLGDTLIVFSMTLHDALKTISNADDQSLAATAIMEIMAETITKAVPHAIIFVKSEQQSKIQ